MTSGVKAAQPWLSDRRYGEGIGIRAGSFELHPGVSAEFGYDSNFFLRAPSERPVVDVWRLRVTPSLSLSTIKPEHIGSTPRTEAPLFNFQASTYLAYSEIFGDAAQLQGYKRNLDAGVGGRLDIGQQRPFGGDVYADFVRNGEPSNVAGTGQTFDRGSVRGGAGVAWRPGGGLFDWRVGYEASYSYFEDQPYVVYNNVQHQINTRGRWRILPRSGFLYDAKYTFIRYQDTRTPQPSGDQLQARVGFSGLVTSRVAFLILGGWNSTYYEGNTATAPQNYDGYVGQAELKFFLTSTPEDQTAAVGLSSVTVGFTHDVSNSYLGAFYTRDRGYLGLDLFLAGVFMANLQGGFGRYNYPLIDAANPGFSQNHVDGLVFAEYRFNDNFGLNGTVMYDKSIGEGPNPQGVALATGGYDNLEYDRVQAYVGLRLFW
ncbi:MAG TPA: outer membrane beta-barrel protein [Polyangiaceae bacterium]|jgi:hypothetical protein|nr:outer membrane beta-barrel protein [Polyangiaceae bacterium]